MPIWEGQSGENGGKNRNMRVCPSMRRKGEEKAGIGMQNEVGGEKSSIRSNRDSEQVEPGSGREALLSERDLGTATLAEWKQRKRARKRACRGRREGANRNARNSRRNTKERHTKYP